MRPNTGVEGCKLVIPDVDECPLCGYEWAWLGDNGIRYEHYHASPTAEQAFDAEGKTLRAVLTWTCGRCGYQHVHQDGRRGSDA